MDYMGINVPQVERYDKVFDDTKPIRATKLFLSKIIA